MITVKFRDLAKKSYVLELAPETTIGQAREKLAAEKIKCEPKELKFLFAKKALNDTATIGSLNLGKNDFIIVNRKAVPKSKKASENSGKSKQGTKPPPAEPVKAPEAIPHNVNNTVKPTEEPKRIIKYYELPVASTDDQLRSNFDKFIRMGLTRSEYSAYLIKAELPTEYNIPLLPHSTPEECAEVRDGWYNEIIIKMLQKNPQCLENFVQRLELKKNNFSGFYRRSQNVIEAFLEPSHLDYTKYNLTAIQEKKAEKLPDEEFLDLYEKAHFEQIDEIFRDLQQKRKDNRLLVFTIETNNILTYYPNKEDQDAVRRLHAVSLKLNVLEVSRIYAATKKDGKYDELQALDIVLKINKDPSYYSKVFH